MFARQRLVLLFGICALGGTAFAQQQPSNLPAFVADQVIVGFVPGTPGQAQAAAHAQSGGNPIQSLDAIGATVVRVAPGRVGQAIAAYENNPNVVYAQANYLRPLIIPDEGQDPPPPTGLGIDYFDEQYGLHNTGQSFYYSPNTGAPGALTGIPDADIDAPEAWDLDTGAAWVKVAILDSGVDCLHPDLSSKCIESINFGPSTTASDEIGHGTHVAGIAAAAGNNNVGIAGVSWGAMIGNLKTCYEYYDPFFGVIGLCDSVAMINALSYAADNGYHVANMSFGGPESGPAEAAAMTYAFNGGVVLVASAGNNYTSDLTYPAAYPEVIAVAATDWFDNLASFSSFGANWVSMAAPGHQTFSTMPNPQCGLPENDPEGCYNWLSGTSMAGPTVAGAAAVVWSYLPGATAAGVRSALEDNADTTGALGQNMQAWTQNGRLNLYAALTGGATPPPPGNASPNITSTPITTGSIDELYSYDVNASDADADILTYSLDVSPTGMTINGSSGLIQWTPNSGQTGANLVSVRVSDGNGGIDTQSYQIQVDGGASNVAPSIDSTPVTTATEQQAYSYDVNASDVDGDSLTYSLDIAPSGMSINASSGLISWTPSTGQAGSHGVTARVDDGNGGSDTQSFSITVATAPAPVNNPPTIDSSPVTTGTVNDLYTYDVNASDADGDTLTYTLDTYPGGMTINSSTGLISWTPATTGNYYIIVVVTDGNGGSVAQNYFINVSPGNVAPSITSTPVTTATVGQVYNYDVDASDADGDTLSYSLDTAPAGMTINSSTGLISWTPAANQVGNQYTIVRVDDGQGGAATQNFFVAVAVGNAAPTIDSSAVTTATEGEAYSYDVNASDADGDTLTYSLDTAPAGMSINAASGLIQWTPGSGQIGSNPVVVRVEDGNGGSDTQSFSISVSDADPSNQAPAIDSAPVTAANVGELYTYDVNASDGDGDTVTYTLLAQPLGMAISAGSGLISWTPSAGQVGSNNVTVRASDGNGGIDDQSFSITVTGGNASPTINSTPVTTATVGQLYSYDVNATDGDGDTLTYSLDAQPLGMSINAGSGVISWTPSAGQEGSQSVTVRVSDGNGGVDTQSFSVNVAAAPPPVNSAPTIDSAPVETATEGQAYTYDVNASDPDGDTLTYSLDIPIAGMTINASTGLIQWTPASNQIGNAMVVARATDP
ncbi:MAG TPA: putative Ig domain-containing protein, partial [Gammaproteobacteria bacterium]